MTIDHSQLTVNGYLPGEYLFLPAVFKIAMYFRKNNLHYDDSYKYLINIKSVKFASHLKRPLKFRFPKAFKLSIKYTQKSQNILV